MMNFEYKREVEKLKAYGKEYEIPTKTAAFSNALFDIGKRITDAGSDAVEVVKAMRDGIVLFIGEDETEIIFPADKIKELDMDEISALWLTLSHASAERTQEVIKQYTPNTEIRKPGK